MYRSAQETVNLLERVQLPSWSHATKEKPLNRYMKEFLTVVTKPDKRQTTRKVVIELKTGQPCLDCGELLPHYMMDFDHVRGEKLGNVETIARLGDMELLLKEVAKCDLICANCHRHRTWMRSAGQVRKAKKIIL